ncbi:hypothetical protein K3495_g6481 [Podosphaera aphanis]|nr:hypothetical protein K3495_g6481 [Podosphaera aphanis]
MKREAEKRSFINAKAKRKSVTERDEESDFNSEDFKEYFDELLTTDERNDAKVAASASITRCKIITTIFDIGVSYHFMPLVPHPRHGTSSNWESKATPKRLFIFAKLRIGNCLSWKTTENC